MTRPPYVAKETIDQALANLGRTTVILAGVADYEELPELAGPPSDMDMLAEIIFEEPAISIYKVKQVEELENPNSNEFRKAIVDYAQGRSARGDILLLYFTGHGCVLPGGSFGFCLSDAKLNMEGNGILPVSVVALDDVVNTLSANDVHPLFIIDACFSSATAPHGNPPAATLMEETIRSGAAESYALLASSSSFSPSLDTPDGGAFTQALHSITMRGLPGAAGSRSPFITMGDLAGPLQEELSILGVPISRCYVGRDFPILPISKNPTFQPQSERFSPYMKRIIELLWNGGAPRTATISEFSSKIGQGAYANHSKLSSAPWGLVEDAGSNQVRQLTSKGKRFAQGRLRIPRIIIRDPFTGNWIPADKRNMELISDL